MNLSVRRHGEKRVGTKSLPQDLLVDVLARVASSSFTDVFNAKLSCKDFPESTKDDYIFQCISIDKFPLTHWFPPSEQVLSFLTHCFNSESLLRKGMIDYFKRVVPRVYGTENLFTFVKS
ncbi:hypothetical protein L1987_58766 [Smallanthus sonchifolius]|uniref:Uncharacterized protein n=1 Tax=Smallanthus sonchifolius TaxID=185202 RepID=A0ACB9D3D0_9ASTR|nr:hypothetical protein L1987_58766 [Smallanthus sonchifolius]